jgi:6-pyruvoyltetrahydropterin/6-carboxytetrahydropterin synthase
MLQIPPSRNDFRISEFERIVDDELIKHLDHKNLNADLEHFYKTNPTVENIATLAWNQLVGKFGKAKLHRVTIWETDKTCCSYEG